MLFPRPPRAATQAVASLRDDGLLRAIHASLAVALFAPLAPAEQAISVHTTPHGKEVRVGGQLFAGYRVNSGGRPVLWPVRGPTGATMTRSYPVGERLPGEVDDHTHHRGVWFGYDKVNGVNFWHDPRRAAATSGSKRQKAGQGRQVHRRFLNAKALGPNRAVIATENDWLAPDGAAVATDRRTWTFAVVGDARQIDFEIEWSGVGGPLELGDSKEGLLAIRVAGWLTVDAGLGGRIVNSRRQQDAAAWGQPATWVDYHAPDPGGKGRVGVAIFSHPSNPRPTPRWHVRRYGLFAANPLGDEPFPPARGYRQGALAMPAGESLTLRYRLFLHRGDEARGQIDRRFREYAAAAPEDLTRTR